MAENCKSAFVYMLRCADNSLYIGTATGDDLSGRIAEHQAGAHPDSYTFIRRPIELIWSEHFPTITDAIAVERKLEPRQEAGAGEPRLGIGAIAVEATFGSVEGVEALCFSILRGSLRSRLRMT
jgi:predicted GIY-YIG superfamily endonuclease